MKIFSPKFLIVFAFLAFLFSNTAFAQTISPVENTSQDMMDSTVSAKPTKVNYELPYPGMLPDNPLYFLKMIRDGIIKSLIVDPYKRSEFDLLNAEKRMYASKFLVEKGKGELTIETISKSNNYFYEGIDSIKKVKKANPKDTNVAPFLEKARTVAQKHKEIVDYIKGKIDKKYLNDLMREDARLDDLLKEINSLLMVKPQNP